MIHERLGWTKLDDDFLEYLDEEGYTSVNFDVIYVEYDYWINSVSSIWSRLFGSRVENEF
jgi:hypothetical protein